jgi:hypothetical protein
MPDFTPDPAEVRAPVIIDVEASGFGRGSYPIEIGIALASGRTACFLIRPEEDWTHWSDEAAALHGLCREVLQVKGRPAADVARALNELLAGATAYSDAWGMDSSWVGLLFERAALPQRFRIEALSVLLDEPRRETWAARKREVRAEMNLARHRASADALVIQRALMRSVAPAQAIPGPQAPLSGATPG